MTYDKLIEIIKKDTIGIAKGYSVSFLQDEFSHKKTKEDLFALFKKDLAIFKDIENVFFAIKRAKRRGFC